MRRQTRIWIILLAALTALLLAAALVLLTGRVHLPRPAPAAVPAEPEASPTPVPVSALRGVVVISELMEKNRSVAADEDGDFSDWIELYNAGDETVSLGGWRIADEAGGNGWELPDVRLAGGDRMLVFASKKDRRGSVLHTDFGLSADEELYLRDAEGALVDSAACGGCRGDVSMALGPDGQWAPSLYPTPGFENTRAGYEKYQQLLTPAGPLVINEAAVANFGLLNAGGHDDCDWVELKNVSDGTLLLSDYYLSDDRKDLRKWRMPETSLRAGERILFVCDGEPGGRYGSILCTGFSLDSTEDQLYLTDGAGRLLDCVSLRDIPVGGSYGRMDGLPGFFFFAKPTPGRDNADGARFVAVPPVSLTPDGVYENTAAVTLTLRGEGTIRYTLDGSLPTEESPAYTGPLKVDKTCAVRAVCFAGDALPSRPLNLSFFLNEGHSLPVVSLVTDSPRGFDGMYDGGHKGLELPGALALYRGAGADFSIGCGVSMNGETSLLLPKKNMALRFRGAYGQEFLYCDLFGGGVTEFRSLLLRAGQDQDQAVIRNELAQRLCELAGGRVVNQRSLFCALYINGQYRGLYTLKEKANEQLYASLAGVSRKSVELYEAPIPYGSDLFEDFIHLALTGDMRLDENYGKLCAAVDIDSLIDWLFFEGYCANTDVTSGNLRYVRSAEADGKWRLMFYDLDAAFRNPGSMYANLMSPYAAEHIQISGAVLPLMENAQFRDRFLTRAAELLGGVLSNETVLAEIDRMAEEIRPELARDLARFGRDLSGWEWNLRQLRELIAQGDWRQQNVDALCRSFELSDAERARYFGDIDKS